MHTKGNALTGTSPGGLQIGRRAVLAVGLSAAITGSLASPGVSAGQRARQHNAPGARIESLFPTATLVSVDSWSFEAPVGLGFAFIEPADLAPSTARVLRLRWDSGLYAVDSAATLRSAGSSSSSRLPFRQRVNPSGCSEAEFILPGTLQGGVRHTIALGTLRAPAFPNDLVDRPTFLSAELLDSSGETIATHGPIVTRAPEDARPWGAVVGVSWLQDGWPYPELVSVRSVGPYPVPAGWGVQVQLPKGPGAALQFVAAVDPSGATVSGEIDRPLSEGLDLLEWRTDSPLEAGSFVALQFLGAATESEPASRDIIPTVGFLPTQSSTAVQRRTGEESQLRVH